MVVVQEAFRRRKAQRVPDGIAELLQANCIDVGSSQHGVMLRTLTTMPIVGKVRRLGYLEESLGLLYPVHMSIVPLDG